MRPWTQSTLRAFSGSEEGDLNSILISIGAVTVRAVVKRLLRSTPLREINVSTVAFYLCQDDDGKDGVD